MLKMIKTFETADGRKYGTLAQAFKHLVRINARFPDYIWIGGKAKYKVYENGAVEELFP